MLSDANGRDVKLVDFGLSLIVAQRRSTVIVGTLPYLAPVCIVHRQGCRTTQAPYARPLAGDCTLHRSASQEDDCRVHGHRLVCCGRVGARYTSLHLNNRYELAQLTMPLVQGPNQHLFAKVDSAGCVRIGESHRNMHASWTTNSWRYVVKAALQATGSA